MSNLLNKKEQDEWNSLSNKSSYYKNILSPIKNSHSSPLLTDLKKIKGKKSVADLGCGLGELLPLLSSSFKKVTALDFSKEMILSASSKNKNLKNVNYVIDQISNLTDLETFDVIMSINSLLTPNLKELDLQFKAIFKSLKKEGTFIAIVPAMESYLYQSYLIAQANKEKPISKIRSIIKDRLDPAQHIFPLALTNFDGLQKNYYRFELIDRLKKAGFSSSKIKIKKVLYSWKEYKKAGENAFPGQDLPWDWYVICKK